MPGSWEAYGEGDLSDKEEGREIFENSTKKEKRYSQRVGERIGEILTK